MMWRARSAWLLIGGLLAAPVAAQGIVVPYTFVNGTAADADQVNADFTAFANSALNRTNGAMTGPLVTQVVTPDADGTRNLGAVATRYNTGYFVTVSGAYDPAGLSAVVPITKGGTNGTATPTNGGILYGTGTAYAVSAAGMAGEVLQSNGAAAPSWGAAAAAPAHQISAFNLAACPTGWTEYTALRGRYLVGLPAAGTLAGTSGTALTNLEARAVGQHTHTVTDPGHTHGMHFDDVGATSSIASAAGANTATPAGFTGFMSTNTTGVTIQNAGAVAGTNAPYGQFLMCEKS